MTTDVAEAVRDADLIMLVVPSAAHAYYARHLAPLLDGSRPIFINPGHTGGGLHLLHELRQAGYCGSALLCETVTLTYVARMEGTALVGIYNYNKRLRFAALPAKHTAELLALVKPLYPEIEPASSVLETALSNMNAIFHPPGMIMNAGWIQHTGKFPVLQRRHHRRGWPCHRGHRAERLSVAKALDVSAAPFLDVFCDAGLTTAAGDRRYFAGVQANPTRAPVTGFGNHRYCTRIGFGLVAF
jgi:opine dehydrogenase